MNSYRYARSPGRWDNQSWSLTLGSIFGIRVRVHLTFLLLIAFELLFHWQQIVFEATFLAFLFALVLLHEFGHCLGTRLVGGEADDVLLWPLGGLASTRPPHRPFENLVTTLCGPGVNAVVLVLLLPVMAYQGLLGWSLFNPFTIVIDYGGAAFFTYLCFKANYILLVVNLFLPLFPFDGGRVLQEVLWFRIGYYRATVIATNIGLVGGVVLAGIGLYLAGAVSSTYFMLTAIAIFGFYASLMVRRDLEMTGALMEGELGYDFSEGYTSLEKSVAEPRPISLGLAGAVRAWLRARRARQEARAEAELDRILSKIHNSGIESLTWTEKRLLHQASKRRRR